MTGTSEPGQRAHEVGARADVEGLIARLQTRVAKRKADGTYPAGLDDDLDAHFQRIATHRPSPYDYERLSGRIEALENASRFSPAQINYDSGFPGGSALHQAVGRAVSRQTAGVFEQLNRFSAALQDVLKEVAAVLEHPNAHVHVEVLGQIDALMEQAASSMRTPRSVGESTERLERRLDRLEASEAKRTFRPWFGNAKFEEEFRGTQADLAVRYGDLAESFVGFDPVVDLGCGRGEFLELLQHAGVKAAGVEIDPELVRYGTDRNLEVEQDDLLDWLQASADESLGGIALIQVIEHITPQQRSEVVRLAAQKLRPGGRLLVETLNPQSLYIYARAFYVDPTHDTPMHPAYLAFLLREAGFSEISTDWRSMPPAAEMLQPIVGGGEGFEQVNQNLEKVNNILFGPQDYAISAIR